MELIKQYDERFTGDFSAIQTDGCFWRSLLAFSELATSNVLTIDELKRAYRYAIPDYMEDHREEGKSRCYIQWKGHEEIARSGFYIVGERHVKIEYRYRRNNVSGQMIIGKHEDFYACNYYITECELSSGNSHFYVSDLNGVVLWNPHTVISNDILSLRGFRIVMLKAA